ncbi:CBS domain-containing protein [Lentiprolixibacter aurantiacus]|uniref:CBS domain-containing protein n=1 Tax=Lentiprolixibacter aurantiacus TaxID=2993939 RepID=A0AAE3MIM8_9FLAO|nr:CBS domain-containing protein [Lentiprolixibacter aurantiacus]MCX2718495.1 CBS domain-containing protein [Lentiprolixibacter aurantiacus]
MGELNVKKLSGSSDKIEYIDQLVADIEALDKMLKMGMFENSPIRIGAEQEFCLADESWNPSNKAEKVLEEINDDHFTNELTRYNLEINLDPYLLEGDCFSKLHEQLDRLLLKAKEAADKVGDRIILTGILPTIDTPFLGMDYMTPMQRYRVLNDAIKSIRKEDIELHIKGVDEVNLHHDTILYEGCNTSFQCHLQIDPDDFANSYNWAQAIAGPVLSVCTNSPLLLGKELWEETRIALFTQSVDTRASTFILNEKESRVSFGTDWVCCSAADFFKDAVIQFRSLISTDFESDSLTELESGKTPRLRALQLHNGTIYKWNRVCYGVADGKPHLRIENRYLPSGPTTDDEIANMMLWVGLMRGRPKEFEEVHKVMNFKDVKGNFFNAARYGMAAQFYWNGELISSHDLLLDHLLPMAFRGLYSMGVSPRDAEHYLSIIEKRTRSNNGSRWMVEAYRKLVKHHSVPDALKILVATMHERKEKKYTVDAWQLPRGDEYEVPEKKRVVRDFMTTKILSAQENDSAQLVLKMMEWKNIHHTPILDNNLELAGLLSWTDVSHYLDKPEDLKKSIRSLMKTDLITVNADTPLDEAKSLMEKNNIHCLPVVNGTRLVGIITSNDI